MPARRPPPRATSCIAFSVTKHQGFISHCRHSSLHRCVAVSQYRCISVSLSCCVAVLQYRCVTDMFCRPRGVTEKSEELSWMLSYTDALPVLTLAQVFVGRIYLRGFFGSRGALGPLLGALGRSWDALGTLLGLSWALLEMIFASTFVQVAFCIASLSIFCRFWSTF